MKRTIKIFQDCGFRVCQYTKLVHKDAYEIHFENFYIDLDAKNIIKIFNDNGWNVKYIHFYSNGFYLILLVKREPLSSFDEICISYE